MKKAFVGTSGYNYKGWKERFYPKDLPQSMWLAFYAQHFNTVEINATFYGSFKKATFENWSKQAPKDFRFCIKGSRFITHIKRIKGVGDSIKRFFDGASGLGSKLKLVLWQFPSNFKLKEDNLLKLKKFLDLLPRNVLQAFEFRHESWLEDEASKLLNQHKAGWVINDSAKLPRMEIITGSFAYIRFHGPTSLYSSSYSDAELKEWAKKIKQYLKKVDVYCYFNNDVGGYAIENAKQLLKLLAKG